MSQRTLGEVCQDSENPPAGNTDNNFGEERIRRMLTWKGVLLLIGLLFLVAVFNMTAFFVLRPAFSSSLIDSHQNRRNPIISKTCGGIVNILGNQKGYIVDEFDSFERCAWIIKSEMKQVRVQYGNGSLEEASGAVIGKLVDGDEELRCSKMDANDKLVVRTPFVLYFTVSRPFYYSSWRRTKFVLEFAPVDDEGSHESQPATYHINKLDKGSLPLAVIPLRSESLLGMVAVFQNRKSSWNGRDFVCSQGGTDQCCDYVAAYSMDLFSEGGSCEKMSKLNEGNGKQSSDKTVIALYWSHHSLNASQCSLTWSATPARVSTSWRNPYGHMYK